MALFGKKKTLTETKEKKVKEEKKIAPSGINIPHDTVALILKPRITEKASLLLEKNVYTFEVAKGTSKDQVRDAIKARYQVTPVKITMVNKVPRRSKSAMRGRMVAVAGLRKAYVHLKEGDRIDLI
jgi:large subunit ribosomal protein L23